MPSHMQMPTIITACWHWWPRRRRVSTSTFSSGPERRIICPTYPSLDNRTTKNITLNTNFYASSANNRQRQVLCILVICPAVCPSVRWHNISLLSGGVSMELATNIHYVSGNCQGGVRGHWVMQQRPWKSCEHNTGSLSEMLKRSEPQLTQILNVLGRQPD